MCILSVPDKEPESEEPENSEPAGVAVEGCMDRQWQNNVCLLYNYIVGSWGQVMSLDVVMKAVLCGAPKQSQRSGSPSLRIPSSVLEFTLWRANVFSNRGSGIKVRCSHRLFSPSHIETEKKKFFIMGKTLEFSGFQYCVYIV